MSKNEDYIQLEGRVSDGWEYALDLVGDRVVRVRDHDAPPAVWARIEEARKAKRPSFMFSGARAVVDGKPGKLDGWAVYPVDSIVGLRNWGSAALGAQALEVKLDALEARVVDHENRLVEVEDSLDELEVVGGTEAPASEVDAAGARAMAAAAKREEEGGT